MRKVRVLLNANMVPSSSRSVVMTGTLAYWPLASATSSDMGKNVLLLSGRRR